MTERARFVMRPRLAWRLIAGILSIVFTYAAVTESDWLLLLIALASWVWTTYLFTAQVTLHGPYLSIERFGRRRRLVRLDRLERWDTHFGGPIPTPTLTADDTDGGHLGIDRVWWDRWTELRDLVSATRASRANLREELGRFPFLKIALLSVLAGIVVFGAILARQWGDAPTNVVLVDSAMWGILGGLGFGAWLSLDYWDSERTPPDDE